MRGFVGPVPCCRPGTPALGGGLGPKFAIGDKGRRDFVRFLLFIHQVRAVRRKLH